MSISLPKRRNHFKPIGFLRKNSGGAKKSGMVNLNLTAMVDMFTTIVIFLIQSFSASGELMLMQKDLVMAPAMNAELLSERGPVVTMFQGRVLVEGTEVAKLEDLDEAEQGIEVVTEQLKGIRERDEKLYKRDPSKPFDGHVIVNSDKATDFLLVRKVIYSMNQAGWAKVNFAVQDEGGPDEAPAEGGEAAEGGE